MRAVFVSAILGGLAGCAGGGEPNLALSCQVTKCTCAHEGLFTLGKGEPSPVLWQANGDAYCPDGQALRRAGYKKKFIEDHGG